MSPSPPSGVKAAQAPTVPLTVDGVATLTLTTTDCQCSTLRLLSLGGSVLGSVTLAAGAQPPPEGGTEGIYYLLGLQLMKLGADGATSVVGTVAKAPTASGASVAPEPGPGALAVAPGGTRWAYLQSVSIGGNQTEQVWVGQANGSPKLLLSTTQSPGAPSSEFPNGWTYQLMGWVDSALVLAQVPSGSDSFASAAIEVSSVNIQTGAETLLSNSQNCPIGAIAGNGVYLCFQQGGGQATELVTGTAGISTGAWSLSPGSGYGDAFFNPSANQIVFSDCEGCGASPSAAYLASQMEILNTLTGSIQSIGAPGLVPDAWLPNGQIVATRYSQLAYARKGAAPLSEVALVDPDSGQLTGLTTNTTSQFAGVATS